MPEDPEAIRTYYKEQFEVTAFDTWKMRLRLTLCATTYRTMLEGPGGIRSCRIRLSEPRIGLRRFGTVFWGMSRSQSRKSLGNLFVRHWLGLLYLLRFINDRAGNRSFPHANQRSWLGCPLGIDRCVYLCFFLVEFIAGRRGWLRALGG